MTRVDLEMVESNLEGVFLDMTITLSTTNEYLHSHEYLHPQASSSLVILIWNMQANGIGRGSHFAEGGEFISSGKKWEVE